MKKIVFTVLACILCLAACNKKNETIQDGTIIVKNEMTEERTGDELKIVAIITVKPEYLKEIMPLYQNLVQASQEEEGCIFYNLHQDIADSTKLFMLEEWQNQAAIDFHNNTDHFKNFKELSKGMVEKSEVTIMKLIY